MPPITDSVSETIVFRTVLKEDKIKEALEVRQGLQQDTV